MTADRLPFHYAWVIAGAGALVVFACLGLARFSFGMLLPSMGAALELSYSEKGAIGTGYFIGYLVVVAAVPFILGRIGARRAIAGGLALIGLTMVAVGSAHGFLTILLLYTLTGIGSGAANISIMALVSRWFAPAWRGRAAGIALAGNGPGIILSGLMIPALDGFGIWEGWRLGWSILGAVSVVVAVVCWLLLRDSPEAVGQTMLGGGAKRPAHLEAGTPPSKVQAARRLTHLGLVYALFGATYIVYGTFIVTTLVDSRGFEDNVAGTFWAWVGFFSMFSGPLFGGISDRFGRRAGLMSAYAVQTAAYLLVSSDFGAGSLYASIFLYGIAAWSIPTIMAAAVADYLGPDRAAAGLSAITFFFAIGQTLGPVGAGVLADVTGDFTLAYTFSASLTGLAVILSLALPRPRR